MHPSLARRARRSIAPLACALLASAAFAQTAPQVVGTVRDATGLPLAEATVTIATEAGQRVTSVKTNDSGTYAIDGVSPARYIVTVERRGFAAQSRRLTVDATTRTLDFVLPVDVLAQTVTVSARSPDSFHVQTATSALRTDVPLMDVPQAVSIVSAETIEQQDIRNIGEVARTVSGMGRAIGYSESADKFMIRGLLIDYALKNGFKNSSVLSFSDMANVERIEVLKGPSALLYGRIEPGGVVNVVTKPPLSEHQQRGEVTVGPYVSRGVVDVTGPLGASARAAFRVIGAGEHDGSHRDFVSRNTGFFAPSLSWKTTDRTTVSFEGEALRMSGVPDAGLPSHPVSFTLPIDLSVGEPDHDSIRNRNLRAAFYLTHRFTERWSLSQAASVLRADAYRKQVSAVDGSVMADGRTFARRVLDEREASLSHFLRVDLIGKPEFRGAHVVLGSLELGRERYENGVSILTLGSIDLYEPRYGAPYPPSGVPQQVREQGADTLGLVLQDQWSLATKWKLAIGGRADVARTLYFDQVNQPPDPGGTPVGPVGPPAGGAMPPGGGGPVNNQNVDPLRRESTEHVTAFSPRLGLVFQPTRAVSLYASYSRSFNPLQLIHYINLVNLEPFRARQYEAGAKLDLFGARLQTTAAAFWIESTGYVLPAGRPGSFTTDGYKRSSGFELESTARSGPLAIIAAYTFNDGSKRVGFPGRSLMNAARNSGSVWATLSARDGRATGLTAGAGLSATGDRIANLSDTLLIPAYARFDTFAEFARGRWAIQVNLKNLTNERYYDTDAVQGLLIPGEPFSAVVALRIKL